MQSTPTSIFVQAAVDLQIITLYQGEQTLQHQAVLSGEKPPFAIWLLQGLVSVDSLSGVLQESLRRLAQDATYGDRYREDLVLASILLDTGCLKPIEIHTAICRLDVNRTQGGVESLAQYLDRQNILSLDQSRAVLVGSTFPTWLPLVRRRKIDRRRADLGPPSGIPERRRAERRKISEAIQRQRSRQTQIVVGAISLVASVLLVFGFFRFVHDEPRPTEPVVSTPVPDIPAVMRPVELPRGPTASPIPMPAAVATENSNTETFSHPAADDIPEDLLTTPDRAKALIDASRNNGNTHEQKLDAAESLLRGAMDRLERYDTPAGRALHGECQALLHLVLKLKTH